MVTVGVLAYNFMSDRSRSIADTLTNAILNHSLSPGAKLGERELSEIFNVSRIVVRQALIRLADDGLVYVERNRGAFVAKPGTPEVTEIYEAMMVIEQGVAMQLSERIGPEGWVELRAVNEQQRLALAEKDHSRADMLSEAFHTTLLQLSGNKVMQEIHAKLMRRAKLIHSFVVKHFDRSTLLENHQRIVDHLEKRRLKLIHPH